MAQTTTHRKESEATWKRTRESRLILSVTPAEATAIKALAQAQGKTMQAYLMSLVLEDVAAAKNGGA
jgi:hypothetical protein